MLFNTYLFIFLFLPVALIGYFWLVNRRGSQLPVAFLVAMSLVYYGWWNPAYLLLICGSVLGNFFFARRIMTSAGSKRFWLTLGVTLNLALLGYYKYTHFLLGVVNDIAGTGFSVGDILLPLGISFFTFQQIAYLVDSARGITGHYRFVDYCLFVTFFPQLIAGPIVHHRQMMPQFADPRRQRFSWRNIGLGSALFTLGLAKKVLIADQLAPYSTDVFNAFHQGQSLSWQSAWLGTLAYTLQLYFDFSGYTDMATGIARMFGILLPWNFNSPYKARSIVEFWRRWHMTLSQFLRDYLYIPLGGNRKGPGRRYLNLFTTMLLGGLWHGASWNFVLWGALHGLYLGINHAWSATRLRLPAPAAWTLTFIAVMTGWVFFRALDFNSALAMLTNMYTLADGILLLPNSSQQALLILGLGIALVMPNARELILSNRRARRRIRLNKRWAMALGLLLFVSVAKLSAPSEFLYYQF